MKVSGTGIQVYGWWLGHVGHLSDNVTFALQKSTTALTTNTSTVNQNPDFNNLDGAFLGSLPAASILYDSSEHVDLDPAEYTLTMTNFGAFLAVDYFKLFLDSPSVSSTASQGTPSTFCPQQP